MQMNDKCDFAQKKSKLYGEAEFHLMLISIRFDLTDKTDISAHGTLSNIETCLLLV